MTAEFAMAGDLGTAIILAESAAGATPVGHHYFMITTLAEVWEYLTPGARQVANGFYSGRTDPNHSGRTPNRIVNAVLTEFEKHFKHELKNKIKITDEQMFEFIQKKVEKAPRDSVIGEWQRRRVTPATGSSPPKTVADALERGENMKRAKKAYLNKKLNQVKSGHPSVKMGILAGAAFGQIVGLTGVLNAASENEYLQKAIDALEDPRNPNPIGDAERWLLGSGADTHNLIASLLGTPGLSATAILNLQGSLENLFDSLDH